MRLNFRGVEFYESGGASEFRCPAFYTFLKFDNNRFVREGRNGCRGVLEVIDGGVAVGARRVHGAKRRVIIQHTLLRLKAVVENECSRNADPFVALHGAKFHFGVGFDLLCNAFAFARLDIQFAFKQMYGAERPHARLVAFHGGEIVRFGSFQKFIDAVHGSPLQIFLHYTMRTAQKQALVLKIVRAGSLRKFANLQNLRSQK